MNRIEILEIIVVLLLTLKALVLAAFFIMLGWQLVENIALGTGTLIAITAGGS